MAEVIALRRGGVLPLAVVAYTSHRPDQFGACVICGEPAAACRPRANAAKVLVACGLRPDRFDPVGGSAQTMPFYLAGLLFCHAPMRPVIRRTRRRYECPTCRSSVDALSAEVEVWEKAHTTRPELGNGSTPYGKRAALLNPVLTWARLLTNGSYLLRWRTDLRGSR